MFRIILCVLLLTGCSTYSQPSFPRRRFIEGPEKSDTYYSKDGLYKFTIEPAINDIPRYIGDGKFSHQGFQPEKKHFSLSECYQDNRSLVQCFFGAVLCQVRIEKSLLGQSPDFDKASALLFEEFYDTIETRYHGIIGDLSNEKICLNGYHGFKWEFDALYPVDPFFLFTPTYRHGSKKNHVVYIISKNDTLVLLSAEIPHFDEEFNPDRGCHERFEDDFAPRKQIAERFFQSFRFCQTN